MRSRFSELAGLPAADFLPGFAVFVGRSASRVVLWAIKSCLQPSILPQNEYACFRGDDHAYRDRTTFSRESANSLAGVVGGNVRGAPIRMVISPRWAR